MKFGRLGEMRWLAVDRRAMGGFTVAITVAGAIIAVAFYLDHKGGQERREALTNLLAKDVAVVATAIERRLDADFEALTHLHDAISTRPDIGVPALETLADRILGRNEHFAGVGFAPGFDLHSVRPPSTSLGDTRDLLRQHLGTVDDRRQSGSLLSADIAGSKDFVSIVLPVVANAGGEDWGAVALALHKQTLLRNVGLPSLLERAAREGLTLLVSIRQVAENGEVSPIHGRDAAELVEPVGSTIRLQTGHWEILAAPAEGWAEFSKNFGSNRILIILVTIGFLLPILAACLLLRERNRNITALRAREEKLLELSQRFDLAMDSSNIGIWRSWQPQKQLSWDARSAALHGCPPLHVDQDRYADWLTVVHPDDLEATERCFTQLDAATPNGTLDVAYRVILPGGEIRHLRAVSNRSHHEHGSARYTGVVMDVTADLAMNRQLQQAKETSDIKNAELELALDELSRREHELAELSHKFDLALASYHCGIWEADPAGGAHWDERMHQLYGLPYRDGYVTEEQWLSCLHPVDREVIPQFTVKAIQQETTLQSVQRILLPGGDFRYVRSVGQLHTGRDGQRKIIGISFDVTSDVLLTEELKVAKEEADMRNFELESAKTRIEFNALHDPLTALGNRRKLDGELDELSRQSGNGRIKFSILHLDLDRFKAINDTLGHAAGDAMLVHAANILVQHVAKGDVVARIGGDEFVILAKETIGVEAVSALANRIIEAMSRPVDFEGFPCRCGVSIGIAQANGSQIDARKVLINADIALYKAKERGRNCFQFFTHELQAHIVKSKRMADEMLAGLERDEFTVWYQPQLDAVTREITGAEALVRWNHPDRGVLASGAFLKTADELNVMARIDQLVLERSLIDKMRMTALGLRLPKISVNVSSRRLHDDGLIDSLGKLVLQPGEVCFELVESIFLDDVDDTVIHNIERIKALGIDIEIDDFGTGHTSIVSLLKLKPKRLKIDRQLVMPILQSPQERSLVRQIIDIARSLGVETVAEGVETLAHADLLRQLGCDTLQGFAFAKPLPFDDFVAQAVRAKFAEAS